MVLDQVDSWFRELVFLVCRRQSHKNLLPPYLHISEQLSQKGRVLSCFLQSLKAQLDVTHSFILGSAEAHQKEKKAEETLEEHGESVYELNIK